MNQVEYNQINKNLRVHHSKRERAVAFDNEFYYKFWVPGWEHGLVTRHGIESGFYDKSISCVLDSIIVDSGRDIGYRMHRAQVAGGSRDSWQNLIENTTKETRQKFITSIMEKSVSLGMTVTDMCPSNVVIYNGEISLIDYEGLASFDWLFNSKPQPWEAQNRNLKKYPTPFWRDMSKHIKSYAEQCIGVKYSKDLSSMHNFLDFCHKIKTAVELSN